jgi:hypothetical protein
MVYYNKHINKAYNIMSNKTTKDAELILNVNKTKKKIYQYYKNFKLEAPLFRGGAATYVFLTSMIEQLIVKIIKNASKDVNENKDGVKEITRNKIISTVKANLTTNIIFHEANLCYNSATDYSEGNIMRNKDLDKILIDYFDDEDTILTPQAAMYIKYITAYCIDTCINLLAIIKQNSSAKSIVLDQVVDATRIFTKGLFKGLKVKAYECVEKTKKDDDDKPKKKKKSKKKKSGSDESESDESDGNESDEEENPKKKTKKTKKKKVSESDDE